MMQQLIFDNWRAMVIVSQEQAGKKYYYLLKRCLDLVLALLLLMLLSPLLLLLALLIKLDSPGPVFYIQERVGARRRVRNGQVRWEVEVFPFFKLRSMKHKADASLHQAYIKAFVAGAVEASASPNASFKLERDPRVTRVGAFIRRTSLDELPQLLNVLRGEMSLVGPRPVPTYEAAEYQPDHHARLTALPGVTGLWQVKGRGRVTFEEMIAMDLEYIDRQTLWFDLMLLLQTVPAVWSGKGAR